jgi:hypothetical protein
MQPVTTCRQDGPRNPTPPATKRAPKHDTHPAAAEAGRAPPRLRLSPVSFLYRKPRTFKTTLPAPRRETATDAQSPTGTGAARTRTSARRAQNVPPPPRATPHERASTPETASPRLSGVYRHSNRHAPRNIPKAQCAFKVLMIHWILQFALRIAFRCVLHRCESQDIHR